MNNTKRRRIPDRVAEAMTTILDYFWQAEAKDVTRSSSDQQGHIFQEMLLVRQWLTDRGRRARRNSR